MRGTPSSVRRKSAVLLVGAVLLSACQSGPAEVADGDYRAYAASAEVGGLPPVTLTVDGATLTFAEGDVFVTAESSPGDVEYVVCPPDGKGTPAQLGEPLSLGTSTFEEPAVVGDCGQASPRRLTIVDLSSADGTVAPFPFTRWVEFCDTSDPDC